MMENSKFLTTISTIFTTSKFVGVFPFQGRSPLSKLLNHIPLLILMLCLVCEGYYWYLSPGVSPWVDSSAGWHFKLFSYPPFFYALLYHVALNFLRSDLIKGVFVKLVDTEAALERLLVVEYVHAGRQRKVLVFMMIVKVFNICGIQDCWTYNWSYLKVVKLFIHIIGRVALVVIVMQFVTILQAIRDQIRTMTMIVQNGSKLTGRPVSTQDIEKLLRIYNELQLVCPTVNASYSNQLLGIIMMDYININVNAYRIVTYFSLFFADEEPLSLFWLFVRFMGFAQSTLVLFHIVGACSALKEAAENFNKALYRQVISGANQELQYSDILSAHLSVARIPVFTACGLFNLNYEMIYSVCASNVTFIVLAIQMF